MNEQESVTLLKQKILDYHKVLEEIDKDEEFQKLVNENIELAEQEARKKILLFVENIPDSQKKAFLLILTEDFIEKNGFSLSLYDIFNLVEFFLENLEDENFNFRNQLLNNTEFMNVIKKNSRDLITLFKNSTDEKAILNFLKQYVKEAEKPNGDAKTDFSEVYREIFSLQTISKSNKINLLSNDDYLNYTDHWNLTKILSKAIFTNQEKQEILNKEIVKEKLTEYDLGNIIVSMCDTKETLLDLLINKNYIDKVSLEVILSSQLWNDNDLNDLIFHEQIYPKLDGTNLQNIIAECNLSFEEKKKLLFDDRIFSKLTSIDNFIRNGKFTSNEVLELIFNEKINKLASPYWIISKIFEENPYHKPITIEDKIELLQNKNILPYLDQQIVQNILKTKDFPIETLESIMLDDNFFYKAINEYHPQYNPRDWEEKGPYLYDKKAYFLKLYKNNRNILRTLNLDLLNDRILDNGFDFIEKISKYPWIQSEFCRMYNYFERDATYFENMKNVIEHSSHYSNLDIVEFVPRLIESISNLSAYSSNPEEVKQLSLIKRGKQTGEASYQRIDISTLTEEDWQVLTEIGLRDESPYYLKIELWGRKKIDHSLNIHADIFENNDLRTYQERRCKKCDEIFLKSLSDKNLEQAQNAYFNKYLKINIQEAREIERLFSSSIKEFNKNEYKENIEYIEKIQRILKIEQFDELEKEYNHPENKIITFDDFLYKDSSIRQMFSKNIADNVYKVPSNNQSNNYINYEVVENGQKAIKKIPVYEPNSDFKMLIHSTAAYGEMQLINNNYYDSWNKSERKSNHGICCSLIANDNLGMAKVNDVLFGFSDWSPKAISKLAPYDIYSSNDGYNLEEGRPLKFMTAQDIIDNTRHTHNEIVLERVELRSDKKNTNIQPDYVIIYSDMPEEIKQKALKCASEMNIPIVYLDKEKIVKREVDKLTKMINEFDQTQDINVKLQLLEKILLKHENNRSGLRITNPDWLEKYFPTEKINHLFKEVIDIAQTQYQNTDSLLEYYQISNKIIDILEKEEKKFEVAQETTERQNNMDISAEDYKKILMQFIDSSFCKTNIPKLETIVITDEENRPNLPRVQELEKINKNRIYNAIRDIQQKELYPTENKNHNIGHIERVILFTELIGEKELTNNDILDNHLLELAIECAKYHDCGRENDKKDKNHGMKSAQIASILLDSKYNEIDKKMISTAIEYHELEDDEYRFKKICEKYELDEKYREQALKIANILKDADALDRTRFTKSKATLDEDKLRTPTSKILVDIAKQINKRYKEIDREMYKKFILEKLLQQQNVDNLEEETYKYRK